MSSKAVLSQADHEANLDATVDENGSNDQSNEQDSSADSPGNNSRRHRGSWTVRQAGTIKRRWVGPRARADSVVSTFRFTGAHYKRNSA